MIPNGIDCGDSWHCCPPNTRCHPECNDGSCTCIDLQNSETSADKDSLASSKKSSPVKTSTKDKKSSEATKRTRRLIPDS